MKSGATQKKFPGTSAEWEALIAAAPGEERPMTAREEVTLSSAVVVQGGGYAAVKAALAAKRSSGQRGAQRSPTKQLVSVRYSPEVLQYFKSTGDGWQTRMNDALLEWVHQKSVR